MTPQEINDRFLGYFVRVHPISEKTIVTGETIDQLYGPHITVNDLYLDFQGYNVWDYFDKSGNYLGADMDGIAPVFRTQEGH